jgi:hypothetical protein
MTWEEDVEVVTAFDEMILTSFESVNKWMTVMHEKEYLGSTPPELLIRVVANFFNNYVQQRGVLNIEESLTMSKAMLMEDPILHHLVQMNVGEAVSRKVES